MARKRHPKKEVEKALVEAEEHGWTVETNVGHWGRMRCATTGKGCSYSINGTPKSAGNEAKRLRKMVVKCPHQSEPGLKKPD